MKHQRRAGIGCGAFAQARRPRDHVESRAQRALGVVFMRNRRPEQGEQRVADELVDETAKMLDRCRQLLEQFVLQGPHQLRVELLAQCGEAAEVGKQHRDSAAIGFGLGPWEAWKARPEATGGSTGRLGLATACRELDPRRLRPVAELGCPVDLSATSRTKREVGRAGIAAAGTEVRLLCSAFWAEGKAALDFETATAAVHRPTSPRRTASTRRAVAPDDGSLIAVKHGPAADRRQAASLKDGERCGGMPGRAQLPDVGIGAVAVRVGSWPASPRHAGLGGKPAIRLLLSTNHTILLTSICFAPSLLEVRASIGFCRNNARSPKGKNNDQQTLITDIRGARRRFRAGDDGSRHDRGARRQQGTQDRFRRRDERPGRRLGHVQCPLDADARRLDQRDRRRQDRRQDLRHQDRHLRRSEGPQARHRRHGEDGAGRHPLRRRPERRRRRGRRAPGRRAERHHLFPLRLPEVALRRSPPRTPCSA